MVTEDFPGGRVFDARFLPMWARFRLALTRESKQPVLVLTSGANRVDEERIGKYVGEPIRRAEPDFVRRVTGFAIGGVPPIGHVQPMVTYIDEDLLQYETVWAAAGTPRALFERTPEALQEMTAGKAVRVKA